jgi:hypothetical protein
MREPDAFTGKSGTGFWVIPGVSVGDNEAGGKQMSENDI